MPRFYDCTMYFYVVSKNLKATVQYMMVCCWNTTQWPLGVKALFDGFQLYTPNYNTQHYYVVIGLCKTYLVFFLLLQLAFPTFQVVKEITVILAQLLEVFLMAFARPVHSETLRIS